VPTCPQKNHKSNEISQSSFELSTWASLPSRRQTNPTGLSVSSHSLTCEPVAIIAKPEGLPLQGSNDNAQGNLCMLPAMIRIWDRAVAVRFLFASFSLWKTVDLWITRIRRRRTAAPSENAAGGKTKNPGSMNPSESRLSARFRAHLVQDSAHRSAHHSAKVRGPDLGGTPREGESPVTQPVYVLGSTPKKISPPRCCKAMAGRCGRRATTR